MLFAKKNKTESDVPKKYYIEEVYVLKHILSQILMMEQVQGRGVLHATF